jgi:hypothetical protein
MANGVRCAAIVVGADDYATDPLDAACDDARLFTETIVRLGLVERDDVTLLLSPRPDDPGERGDGTADRDSIRRALEPLYRDSERCHRLYFYFAGHGLLVHKDAARARTESALMPADVTSLASDGDKLIVVDELLDRFDMNGPREQLWFIDACRNLAYEEPSVGSIGWTGEDEVGERAQAVLWAVPKLGEALEEVDGAGVMTPHLAVALETAIDYLDEHGRYAVTMRSVHRYVHQHVLEDVQDIPLHERHLMVPRLVHEEPAVTPLHFIEQPPWRTLTVHVEPDDASPPITRIEVGLGPDIPPSAVWPPNANHAIVELPPRFHWLNASAAGRRVTPGRCAVDVRDGPREVTLRVRDDGDEAPPPGPDEPVDAVVDVRQPRQVPRGELEQVRGGRRNLGPWPTGRLSAIAAAPEVAVEVTGLETPYEHVRELRTVRRTLPVGTYRVGFWLGPELLSAKEVLVTPGAELLVEPGARAEEPSPVLLALEGIAPFQQGVEPGDYGDRPLSVVVAIDSGGWSDTTPYAVLERLTVEIHGRYGEERADLQPLSHQSLVAGRALLAAPEEPFGIVVQSRDVGRVEIASASLPTRGTVLTLRLRSSGAVDATHNLLRLPGRDYPDEPPSTISYRDMVRTLQAGQQLYKSGELGVNVEGVADLLYGKWTDPVLGCMGFYAGREVGAAAVYPGLMTQAQENLERYFGDLADVKVVGALAAERPELLDELLATNIQPLLARSTRALAAHALRRGDDNHSIVATARRIATDQPWTMILATAHAEAVDAVPVA